MPIDENRQLALGGCHPDFEFRAGKWSKRRHSPTTNPILVVPRELRGSAPVAMTIIQSFTLLLVWAALLAYAAYRGYKIFITLLVRALRWVPHRVRSRGTPISPLLLFLPDDLINRTPR